MSTLALQFKLNFLHINETLINIHAKVYLYVCGSTYSFKSYSNFSL